MNKFCRNKLVSSSPVWVLLSPKVRGMDASDLLDCFTFNDLSHLTRPLQRVCGVCRAFLAQLADKQ